MTTNSDDQLSPAERTLQAVRALSEGRTKKAPTMAPAVPVDDSRTSEQKGYWIIEPEYPPQAEEEAEHGTMPWHCRDCFAAGRPARFDGPTNRPPKNGCSCCGSRRIFDCNITPVAIVFID